MLPNNDQTCGWINELPKRTSINEVEGQLSCDWIIIGAGYTGLSAARQLGNMNPNSLAWLIIFLKCSSFICRNLYLRLYKNRTSFERVIFKY